MGPAAQESLNFFPPQAILLAFLGALVTAIAEIWLYIAYSRRSARRAKEGEALRLAETRQAGLSKEPLVSVEEEGEKEGMAVSRRVVGLEEKAEGNDDRVPVVSVSDMTAHGKDTVQTPREEPGTSTIRLRRKPLGRTAA